MVIDNTVLHFMRDYILRKHFQAVCCSDYLYFKYCKLYEIETRLSNEKGNIPSATLQRVDNFVSEKHFATL